MTSPDPAIDLPTIFDPETCTRKGLCPVSSIRNKGDPLESHALYFEQHGAGPEKVVFIMGLNSSSFAWNAQVAHFGRKPQYSALVFDNRGVGHSGTPRGPYTTSGMAEDVIALLNYVGWTGARDLHVVAVSLGGMIAQELAWRIPERIISLTLGVTTPGGHVWDNLCPWKGVVTLAKLTFTKDPEQKIPMILGMVFPEPWLDERADDDPAGRTNRAVVADDYRRRIALTRPQTLAGTFAQMAAGLTHRVAPARLRAIAARVPKVLIVTGDEDHLVHPRHSVRLHAAMPQAEFVQWTGTGHGIHVQHKARFNALLERVFEEGRQRVREGFEPEE